jgi:hypothetical protein
VPEVAARPVADDRQRPRDRRQPADRPDGEYPWQDYPLKDADGTVLDEPLLHRLVYTHDPDDDDDLGLTWQLIDFELAAQDC